MLVEVGGEVGRGLGLDRVTAQVTVDVVGQREVAVERTLVDERHGARHPRVAGRTQGRHVAGPVELPGRLGRRGRWRRRRRGRRRVPAEVLERVGVPRREHQDLAIDLLGAGALLRFLEDARELLEHRDGLALLVERLERLRQERQRLDVARIRLEADLELLQRAPRIAAAEVEPGELAVEITVVGAVPEQTLGDLDEVVLTVLAAELIAHLRELGDRLLDHLLLRVQLGELDPRRDVLRIEVDELAHRGQRLLGLALAVEVRGDRLEVLHRVRHQAELAIQLRELEVDLDQARVELEDLLVDRDGLREEALVLVVAGDLQVRLGRLLLLALAGMQVADLQPDADVGGVLLDDAEVLLDRLVELTLVDELPRRVHDLLFVEGHAATSPPPANRLGPRRSRRIATVQGYGPTLVLVKEGFQ